MNPTEEMLRELGACFIGGMLYVKRPKEPRFMLRLPAVGWLEQGDYVYNYVSDFIIEIHPQAFVDQLEERYRERGAEIPPPYQPPPKLKRTKQPKPKREPIPEFRL